MFDRCQHCNHTYAGGGAGGGGGVNLGVTSSGKQGPE